ncbi:Hypothetical protein CM240_0776 [Clostridium bornimense]|uniref:Polysaccharide pyruvyl transferase domain-containing protein n=1 Tax=Clostridium bornimense TaxID=1216932 RepID=W6RTL7_9CLOT|nr:polysaccharide pyruvyl transferase family protein [Clostridium bornimense]CDM67941.1 Hypothetical protein CM240_0776 [Clostridium bornimense]
MKVLINRVYNTYNIGSAMMAINLIYYMYNNEKEIEFYTDIDDEDNLRRLRLSCCTDKIYMNNIKLSSKTIAEKVIDKLMNITIRKFDEGKINFLYSRRLKKYAKAIEEQYTKVIILGGDDLSSEYPLRGIMHQIKMIDSLSDNIKVILFGHTLGPFEGKKAAYIHKVLEKCMICPRDIVTYDYLKERLRKGNIELTADLAFLDLPNPGEKYRNNKFIKGDCDYITLIPSGLYKYYTNDRNRYLEVWSNIVKSILNNKELRKYKIIFMSHVTKPDSVSDILIIDDLIEKLNSQLSEELKKRIVRICYSEMLPYEARDILGGGYFTLTGRMHGAVSTFQMGKPAISIAYSNKYKGVIGGLGFNDLIIDGKGEKLWRGNEIVDEVDKIIEKIILNYDIYLENINISVEKCKKRILYCIKKI